MPIINKTTSTVQLQQNQRMCDGNPPDNSSRMGNTETSPLEYVFFIYNAVFNNIGKTFLRLTVQNDSTHDNSGISVKRNNSKFLRSRSALTDVITQKLPGRTQEFANHKFTFLLPAGYCKNSSEERHVRLLVEAFVEPPANKSTKQTTPEKVGEGYVVVFPRPDVPHKQIPAFPGREIYSMTDVMSLHWTCVEKDAASNFGHVKFSALLKYSTVKAANSDFSVTTERRREVEKMESFKGLSPVSEERIQENKVRTPQLPRAATSTPLPYLSWGEPQIISLPSIVSPRDTAGNEPTAPLARNTTAADVAASVVKKTDEPDQELEARLQEVKHELCLVEQELEKLKRQHNYDLPPVIDDFWERGRKDLRLLHAKVERQTTELARKRATEMQVLVDVEQHKRSLLLVHGELTRWKGILEATQRQLHNGDNVMPKFLPPVSEDARIKIGMEVGEVKLGNDVGREVGRELDTDVVRKEDQNEEGKITGKEVRKEVGKDIGMEAEHETGRNIAKDVRTEVGKHARMEAREQGNEDHHDKTMCTDNLEINLLDLVHSQMIELDNYRTKVAGLTEKVVQLENQDGLSQALVANNDEMNKNTLDLLNTRLAELGDTRVCISQMRSDIRTLQETVMRLTMENERLQLKCKEKKDEISQLIESEKNSGKEAAMMRTKLTEITNELKTYKHQVHSLHNKLAQYNDLERERDELHQVQDSYCNVQATLNEKIERIKKLEEACSIQHHIIADIQSCRPRSGGGSGNPVHRASEALRVENMRLKEEVVLLLQDRTRDKRDGGNSMKEMHNMDVLSKITMSRLQLIQRLYQRQSRMRALEKQMAENAAAWGKEKAELLVRLHEKTNNGIKCASCQMTKMIDNATNEKPASTEKLKRSR